MCPETVQETTEVQNVFEHPWEEFLTLLAEQQEEFFLSFATAEEFEQWMNRVNPQ